MGDSVVMQEAVLMLPRAGEACVGLIPLLIKLDTKSKECVSCFRVWVILIHMWKKKKPMWKHVEMQDSYVRKQILRDFMCHASFPPSTPISPSRETVPCRLTTAIMPILKTR